MWKKSLRVSKLTHGLYNSVRPDNIASRRPLSFAATRSELPKHFFLRDQGKEKMKNCSELFRIRSCVGTRTIISKVFKVRGSGFHTSEVLAVDKDVGNGLCSDGRGGSSFWLVPWLSIDMCKMKGGERQDPFCLVPLTRWPDFCRR